MQDSGKNREASFAVESTADYIRTGQPSAAASWSSACPAARRRRCCPTRFAVLLLEALRIHRHEWPVAQEDIVDPTFQKSVAELQLELARYYRGCKKKTRKIRRQGPPLIFEDRRVSPRP